jgi:hypothetical protein
MGNGERVEGRVDFQSRFDAHYHFGGMAAPGCRIFLARIEKGEL